MGQPLHVASEGRATCPMERASRRSLTFIWYYLACDDGRRILRERGPRAPGGALRERCSFGPARHGALSTSVEVA